MILCDNGIIKDQEPGSVVFSKLVDELSDDWWVETESIQSSGDIRWRCRPFGVFSSIGSAVFHTYLTAAGVILALSIFCSVILMQATRNLTDMWLVYWVSYTTQNSTGTPGILKTEPSLYFSTSSVVEQTSHLRDSHLDH